MRSRGCCKNRGLKRSLRQTNPYLLFLAILSRKKPDLSKSKLTKMACKQWRRLSEKKRYRYVRMARKEACRRAAKRKRCRR